MSFTASRKVPSQKLKVVHHDRLKPYHGPTVPDWLTEDSAPKEPTQPAEPKSPVEVSSPAPTLPKSTVGESGDPHSASPVPVPAVRRPKRAVRPPMRMQVYLLGQTSLTL